MLFLYVLALYQEKSKHNQDMVLRPQGIEGPWKSGIVLDWHTVDSVCVGENEFGHPVFHTTRSEIGELLYRFKYLHDEVALRELLSVACKYLDKVKGRFEVVVPIPPSDPNRKVTARLAHGFARCLGGTYSDDALAKRKATEELKSVNDPEQRRKLLSGAFSAAPQILEDKIVLLVDDVFRSGATLEESTEVVYKQGHARAVYVLAITRTRRNK